MTLDHKPDDVDSDAGDLRTLFDEHPIPVISPKTVSLISFKTHDELEQASIVVDAFNVALANNDAIALQTCFFPAQGYWKDSLALTYHLRTFRRPKVIAKSLLETKEARRCKEAWKLEGAVFVPATPVLQFIDVSLSFRTESPAASCSARVLLLPTENNNGEIEWKIWILSTNLENLDIHPEDTLLLQNPSRSLDGMKTIETGVFIIGGGNSAAALSARLKAFGVESIMAERNANIGDNWALRYDCMKFHVPTSFAEMPYMNYQDEFQGDHLLSKDELADHLRRFVSRFNLNIITSAKIQSTTYNKPSKKWKINVETPTKIITVTAKHVVQATGIGSQKPHVPIIANAHDYKGIAIHSSDYRNGQLLANQGVKSVLIIGSANTAFDILEDCHAAELEATMIVRSPTYVVPLEYIKNKRSLGAYDFGVAAADRMFLTLPTEISGQLARNLFRMLASQEPDRYAALQKAGFPVLDSAEPRQALHSNLVERAGGHYVDTGGTELLAQGRAGVKAGVEPVAFTGTGLIFSDGSTTDADAVIWCTGYADHDVRNMAVEILRGDEGVHDDSTLGPQEIAARVDATWGVDSEGEIRGMWKRHPRLENYWIMGGFTQQHRWYSRVLALQIKAALEGILPEAYRES
ncbi:hypothetical protein FPSE_06852 [Fusarium pseudograminearum CS3096]|uniref:FAD/NAD(P)-binding domain-containing protein n=1 Tax=Fusarium pseudograminearum (strain CS3096) TaxID=1028729 RepID=K3ULK4_FUSPC|nr:hypothetical protein FPSE_06852 [Fusarium pseudograminearum CS3096]EKJ72956.1 hypothetical protein FPSE_06852 [Fusarium pseudograminearum CS3096]KAF0638471.1 hypothetical protein FPSE5266_06852 [Fusarium pseudograminearum]